MFNTTEEYIHEMYASYKKAEHSMYVSLKYTRTVDVIKNLIDRFVETISYGVEGLCLALENKNEVLVVPDTLIEKIGILREKFNDDEKMIECLDFVLFLRKLSRSEHGKCEEFRKNVTMVAVVDGQEHNINIPILQEYLEKTKTYLKMFEELSFGKKEDSE